MKMLIVSALVCAMMVLTRAAAPPEETPESGQTERCPNKKLTDGISGWYPSNGRCYCYNPKNMTWAGAERKCQDLGGNLASVHTDKEYKTIQDVIFKATNSDKKAWIGGSDAEEKGSWFWSDGTSFKYKEWCRGEPNSGVAGNQHCLQMNYSGGRCWDDLQCNHRLPSVCVRKRK